jgi:hypothetical protein
MRYGHKEMGAYRADPNYSVDCWVMRVICTVKFASKQQNLPIILEWPVLAKHQINLPFVGYTASVNSISLSFFFYLNFIFINRLREFRIRIYLPFWPEKVMRDLHCWEWQQFIISALSSLSGSQIQKQLLVTQVCFRVSPDLLPRAQRFMACWQWWNKTTSLALSSVKLLWLCTTIMGSKSFETLFQSVSCKIYKVWPSPDHTAQTIPP